MVFNFLFREARKSRNKEAARNLILHVFILSSVYSKIIIQCKIKIKIKINILIPKYLFLETKHCLTPLYTSL